MLFEQTFFCLPLFNRKIFVSSNKFPWVFIPWSHDEISFFRRLLEKNENCRRIRFNELPNKFWTRRRNNYSNNSLIINKRLTIKSFHCIKFQQNSRMWMWNCRNIDRLLYTYVHIYIYICMYIFVKLIGKKITSSSGQHLIKSSPFYPHPIRIPIPIPTWD